MNMWRLHERERERERERREVTLRACHKYATLLDFQSVSCLYTGMYEYIYNVHCEVVVNDISR